MSDEPARPRVDEPSFVWSLGVREARLSAPARSAPSARALTNVNKSRGRGKLRSNAFWVMTTCRAAGRGRGRVEDRRDVTSALRPSGSSSSNSSPTARPCVVGEALARRSRRRRRATPAIASRALSPVETVGLRDRGRVDAAHVDLVAGDLAPGRCGRWRRRHARRVARGVADVRRDGRPSVLRRDDVVGADLAVELVLHRGAQPWPSTATNVTSVRPIISAAAVEAVRPGLRIAFSRASLPAAPPRRAAGAPTTRASGLTSRGASIATPTKSPRAPPTIPKIRSGRVHVVAERRVDERGRRRRRLARARRRTARRDSRAGSVRALADRRDRRDAGRADRRHEAREQGDAAPTSERDDHRPRRERRSRPAAGRARVRRTPPRAPFASATPSASPTTDASDAERQRLERAPTAAPAGARRRACAACASSRVRCATVIESVLKMTNAPTKSAMPPNASRK